MIERVLVLGLGSAGIRHFQIVKELIPNAEVRILKSSKNDTHADLQNLKIDSIELAKNYKPNIVVISNPANYHISFAQQFISCGAHILIEKPISNDIVGVAKLIRDCELSARVLMVAYNLRFLDSLKEFRNLLNDGLIGNPLSVRCEVGQYLPTWRKGKHYMESVSAHKSLGGGVLLELSHEIDYLRWIFGEVDWVRATILKQSNLEIDVEDTAHLILGFRSQNDGRQLVATLNMDFIRHDTSRRCTVIGESGSLCWDGISGEVSLFREGEKSWNTLFKSMDGIDKTYFLEWQEFMDAIREGRSPMVTGEDGLRVIEVIEAARVSAELGIQTKVIREPIRPMDSE
jgi:predicted dehydrogenase